MSLSSYNEIIPCPHCGQRQELFTGEQACDECGRIYIVLTPLPPRHSAEVAALHWQVVNIERVEVETPDNEAAPREPWRL